MDVTIAERHSKSARFQRRLPVGAEPVPGEGVHFRVWAPRRQRVDVVVEGIAESQQLEAEPDGYFSGTVAGLATGALYRYQLDGDLLRPDPASRFQPNGPHGASRVVDPASFRWTDGAWPGVSLEGQVIYELHVGAFTPEGTWRAAARELPELAAVGIAVIEPMPVADFPGRFGWGYDGVDLFAPTRLYGEPDDFRDFVNQAHAIGLGVILDVVYNHLGPDGNYLRDFANEYFTDRYENEWGAAIDFDGDRSGPVREFFIANARHWIDEYHLDGLRLDATQQIFDASPTHIVADVAQAVRRAAGSRSTLLVAENEAQEARLVRSPERGGYGLDALWNDDFHHSAIVALTGRNAAYYTDYRGTPQELLSAVKWGCLFQGQHYKWQGKRRGTPALDLPPASFVNYIQNHDQIANSGAGERIDQRTSPGRYRAATALLLLAPGTPMLFMGQEFAASSPFLYFADHEPELAALVRRGRAEFLSQFPDLALPQSKEALADPAAAATFARCKLDLSERTQHAAAYALHRDLLTLRREDPVLRAQRPRGTDGAVLSATALVLRFFGERGADRLLIVNLGRALQYEPAPEPLLAPPEGARWEVRWSSDDRRYGGTGTPPLDTEAGWRIPSEAAVVLVPRPS